MIDLLGIDFMPNTLGGVTGGLAEYFVDHRPTEYTVGATPVTGGMLVELSGNRTIIPAGAGSTKYIGIALFDGAVGEKVTVAHHGVWPVTASGAIAAGDHLICAAGGLAAAAGATPDARTLVAKAEEAISNGNSGRVRIKAC